MRDDAVSYEATGVIAANNGVLLAALNSSSGLGHSITVAISPEMRAALQEIAYDNDLSMSVIVRRAMWDYLTAVYRTQCPDPHDELGRLRGMIQYCIEGPDDPAALKTVLQDALDGLTDDEDVFAFRKAHGRAIPAWAEEGLREVGNVRACGHYYYRSINKLVRGRGTAESGAVGLAVPGALSGAGRRAERE